MTNQNLFPAKKSQQKGAVLLEALIAILIFSFGILAISGLQAVMVKNTTEANYRAEASYIVQQRIGQILVSPDNFATLIGNTDISARLPSGQLIVTQTSPGQIRLRVVWTTPGETVQHNFETNASILL